MKSGWKASCMSLLLLSSLMGCQVSTEQPTVQKGKESLPVMKIIADSEQALAAFRMEEESISDKFGVRLEYHFPNRLNDNYEDFIFASKESFDIYVLFPAKIPQYVERGMLVPLDPYTAQDSSLKDIIPIYRNMYMKYGDHDYGMVYDGDVHLLFYRKDLFQQFNEEYRRTYGVNLTPPQTWKEYDRIARFLTRDLNADGTVDIYGTATFSGDAKRYVWFAERFLAKGGRFFDDNMKPTIAGKEGKEALQEWIALQESGATPPNAMYDWIDLNHVFLQGRAAMVIQWSDTSRFSYDQQKWGSQVAGKVAWSLVPGEKENSPRGGVWIGRVLSISSNSPHPDKAWEIIRYITSEEISSKAVTSLETVNDPYRTTHLISGGKGAFPDAESNREFLNTVRLSLKNTNADLMIPGGWEYMQVLDRNIGIALLHKKSPEQALKDTAVEWEKITDRYGRDQQKSYYRNWLHSLEEVRER